MKITKYKLYCEHSPEFQDASFVEINAEKVDIILDLKMNQYVFNAICPKCNKKIKNTRIAYNITSPF